MIYVRKPSLPEAFAWLKSCNSQTCWSSALWRNLTSHFWGSTLATGGILLRLFDVSHTMVDQHGSDMRYSVAVAVDNGGLRGGQGRHQVVSVVSQHTSSIIRQYSNGFGIDEDHDEFSVPLVRKVSNIRISEVQFIHLDRRKVTHWKPSLSNRTTQTRWILIVVSTIRHIPRNIYAQLFKHGIAKMATCDGAPPLRMASASLVFAKI